MDAVGGTVTMKLWRRWISCMLILLVLLPLTTISVYAANYDNELNSLGRPYVGYSSIDELDQLVVSKKNLSSFTYRNQQCVTYAFIRAKEKLFGTQLTLADNQSSGEAAKNVAKTFLGYGYSESNPHMLTANGYSYYMVAHVDDGGEHIQSNSMVCFDASSNLTSNQKYGHIVFVEEVAVRNGVKYVYYTEGGTGFSSWPVKRMTFDKFYNNGKGYTGSITFQKIIEPGAYMLSPACAPNSCLDVADWGSDNETNIQLWEKTGSDNQLFELVPQTDGSYKIVSVYAKKPLDVYRGEVLDEQNVQIYGDNGTDAANQKWWLEEYEDGYYTITSALSDSMRLDVSAGLEDNGTNIQIYTANDSGAQRWKLTFVRGLPPTISLSGQTIPGQLKVGQSFGLRGTVTASGGKLKEVYGAIVDANGNTVQSKTYSMDSATNNLRYSVNQDLIFNKLPEGTYKYYLSAVASNSYGEAREVLLNATFTVGSGSSSSSSSWASSSSSSSSGSSGSTPTPTQPPVKKETKKPTVTISGQTVPSTQKQGSNFGIRGTVSTDCGKLTWLYGYITDRNGNVLQSGEYFPNSSSDNLRYSINNDLIFDQLSAGSYIYWVKATARNGDQETTETLIYTEFQVVSDAPAATQPPETTPAPTTPAAPAAPAAPNISISEQTIPGSQRVGRNFGIRGIVTTDCGQITRVYGAILDSNGNTLQSGTYYPDSSSVNLRYNINNDLIFDNLSAGNYTYYVEVTANNGGTEKTQVLINAGFTES